MVYTTAGRVCVFLISCPDGVFSIIFDNESEAIKYCNYLNKEKYLGSVYTIKKLRLYSKVEYDD